MRSRSRSRSRRSRHILPGAGAGAGAVGTVWLEPEPEPEPPKKWAAPAPKGNENYTSENVKLEKGQTRIPSFSPWASTITPIRLVAPFFMRYKVPPLSRYRPLIRMPPFGRVPPLSYEVPSSQSYAAPRLGALVRCCYLSKSCTRYCLASTPLIFTIHFQMLPDIYTPGAV